MSPQVTDLPFKLHDNAIVILKGLPVMQCGNCREYLIQDEVMAKVENILSKVNVSSELEVVRFAA
ncbi:MAG: YgiT-type zinc finger protein [Nitrospinae bacterium]|nr:YgiT-type zinc finger protein [Nitrospinota bacterium]